MKLRNLCLTIVLCCFALSYSVAQIEKPTQEPNIYQEAQFPDPLSCKTEISEAVMEYESSLDQKEFRQNLQRYIDQESSTHRDFEIQIHIVTRDDGTGGINVEDVRSEIDNYVNPYFQQINASFLECSPENYINSTAYYNLSSKSEGDDMASDNNRSDVFNIYFVNNADSACGWARFPWDLPVDYIVIANGCATNQSTLVHEIGHYFGLYHTHETAFGEENVTRDNSDGCYNCGSAGDKLCDTEADPRLSKKNINISASCVYSTDSTFADPCNNEEYNPDPTLIMSYSRKACRTLFSPEQYAKMEMIMDNERSYLNKGCPCDRPQAICQDVNITLDGSGNVTISPGHVDGGSIIDCGTGSMSVSPNTFDCSDLGNKIVTLTVTDSLGWESSCQAIVTIEDKNGPDLIAPASDIVVECDGMGNTVAYNDWLSNNGYAQATDECGGSWSNDASGLSDGCGATGFETVTFTYSDNGGNTISTTATFTIQDTDAPTLLCPDDIHLPECEPIATWSASSFDICGNTTIVSDPPSGSSFPKGSTTIVNVTATDECGNVSNCDFVVERDPDLSVDIDPVDTSDLNTCSYGTNANIILGYGGGPTCVTLNATANGGHQPYTYSWEAPNAVPGANFTNSNTASPTFCADFQTQSCVTYVFRVTVTDLHGCQETNEIEVNVLNAGVFADGSQCAKPNNPKVVVCHDPEANEQSQTSICIGPNSVPTHLNPNNKNGHQGDCLGPCNASCITLQPGAESGKGIFVDKGGESYRSVDVSVFPNPFNSRARIVITPHSSISARLTIVDVSGRVVEDLYYGPMKKDMIYNFNLDAEDLVPGIYFANLIGDDGILGQAQIVLAK